MCWSAEASLTTYLFCLFGLSVGIVNGFNPRMLVFISVFSMVQLAEYFIWKNLNRPQLNALASKFLFLILIAEPYAAINIIEDSKTRQYMFAVYTAFLVLCMPFTLTSVNWLSKPGENGHLQWLWATKNNYVLAVWTLFLILPLIISKRYVGFMFAVVSVCVSIYFFWQYDTAGTMWCWIATVLWVYVIAWSIYKNGPCLMKK